MTEEQKRVISKLRKLAKELGTDTLRRKDIQKAGFIYQMDMAFGGKIKPALEAAGLKPSRLGEAMSTTDKELLQHIRDLQIKLGKQPTIIDLRREGKFSDRIYESRFDSFPRARAIALGGIKSTAEWKRYDLSKLNRKKTTSEVVPRRPEGTKQGDRNIFIQAKNLNISGGGRISADSRDIIHPGEKINLGTFNQQVAGTVNNISELTQVVSESNLNKSKKRQLVGDIETVKAQVIKPKPDRKIIQTAWSAAKGAATIGGAAQLVKMIGETISPFLK